MKSGSLLNNQDVPWKVTVCFFCGSKNPWRTPRPDNPRGHGWFQVRNRRLTPRVIEFAQYCEDQTKTDRMMVAVLVFWVIFFGMLKLDITRQYQGEKIVYFSLSCFATF